MQLSRGAYLTLSSVFAALLVVSATSTIQAALHAGTVVALDRLIVVACGTLIGLAVSGPIGLFLASRATLTGKDHIGFDVAGHLVLSLTLAANAWVWAFEACLVRPDDNGSAWMAGLMSGMAALIVGVSIVTAVTQIIARQRAPYAAPVAAHV